VGGNSLPAPYRPPGMDTAARNITSTIGSTLANNVPAQLMPQYQALVGGQMSNPGTAGFLAGGQAAGGYGANAASSAAGGGDYLQMIARMLGTQAFDPQNALYGRTQQQVQDQTRASSAARGLEMTPFGAGVENKANSDFNIDWQNNLLQRMIGGGNAAGNLMNSGVNLSAMAPGLAYQAGHYPYQAFNQIGNNNLGFLNQLSQAGQNANIAPNNAIAQWQNYLNTGNASNQVANQQQQQGFNQNQILGGQLGSSVNAFMNQGGPAKLGNAFYGSSSGTGWNSSAPVNSGLGGVY